MGEQVAARIKWGLSSVGRAPALQAGGREFESLSLQAGKEECMPERENIIVSQSASASMPNLRFVIPRLRRLYIRRSPAVGSKLPGSPASDVHLLREPGLIAQPVRAHA